MQDTDNANDYDLDNLKKSLVLADVKKEDIIFIIAHAFYRLGLEHCTRMFRILHETEAKIILDIVPHTLYEKNII